MSSFRASMAHPTGFRVQFAMWVPSSRSCLNRLVTPMLGWHPNSMMSTQRPSAWAAHFLLRKAASAATAARRSSTASWSTTAAGESLTLPTRRTRFTHSERRSAMNSWTSTVLA